MDFVGLKKLAYLLAAFLLGALTLLCCGRSQPETSQPSEIQLLLAAKFRQLELKIGADKTEWRQNEPIVVSVYLTNNGTGHLIVTSSGSWWDYQISLVDGNDRPVPIMDMPLNKKANRGAISAGSQTIKPGDTDETRIPISEDYEINRKGVYRMTVRRRVGIPGIYEREMISNTITISVVE